MTETLTLHVTESEGAYHAWFEELGREYAYTSDSPGGAVQGAVAMAESTIELVCE